MRLVAKEIFQISTSQGDSRKVGTTHRKPQTHVTVTVAELLLY
jgi:hypothetical protein